MHDYYKFEEARLEVFERWEEIQAWIDEWTSPDNFYNSCIGHEVDLDNTIGACCFDLKLNYYQEHELKELIKEMEIEWRIYGTYNAEDGWSAGDNNWERMYGR